MKTLISILAFSLCAPLFACDASKGLATGPGFNITLQPGVAHVEIWDFSDCNFPIQNESFFITKPRNKSGAQQNLPPNTPLTVTLIDLTTGEVITDFNCIESCGYVNGRVFQMTLTLDASAHKPLDVSITQTACWCP